MQIGYSIVIGTRGGVTLKRIHDQLVQNIVKVTIFMQQWELFIHICLYLGTTLNCSTCYNNRASTGSLTLLVHTGMWVSNEEIERKLKMKFKDAKRIIYNTLIFAFTFSCKVHLLSQGVPDLVLVLGLETSQD